MINKNNYWTASRLKERGWTADAVEKFLGEPDEFVENPYYPSRPPMRMYSIERVEKTEKSEAFLEWRTKYNAKKTAKR